MLSGIRIIALSAGVFLSGCTGFANTQNTWGDAGSTPDKARTTGWGPTDGVSEAVIASSTASTPIRPAAAAPAIDYDTDGLCQVVAPPSVSRKVLKRPERVIDLVTPPEIAEISVAVPLRSATGESAGAVRVNVPRVVRPGHTERVVIGAEYVTVSATAATRIPAVCRVSASTARAVQDALTAAGLFPGPSDGLYDGETRAAVDRFKREHDIQGEGLTFETLRALQVTSNARVSLVSR